MNKHLIEVRYIPATKSKPARISLTSHWDGSRVIFKTSEPEFSHCLLEACGYLRNLGFNDGHHGVMKRGYFIIVNELKSLKVAV